MTKKQTIFTRAIVPTDLGNAWLQHLRDFDVAHPGCHFEVMLDEQNIPMTEMVEMLRVTPGLTFSKILMRQLADSLAQPETATAKDRVEDSCGCVFCDLGLDPDVEIEGVKFHHVTRRGNILCERAAEPG